MEIGGALTQHALGFTNSEHERFVPEKKSQEVGTDVCRGCAHPILEDTLEQLQQEILVTVVHCKTEENTDQVLDKGLVLARFQKIHEILWVCLEHVAKVSVRLEVVLLCMKEFVWII